MAHWWFGASVLAILLTAVSIYFTPLRYTPLIEPKIQDVESGEIHARIVENPDAYLFIDVRNESDYSKMHAEGSINIPIAKLYDMWHQELPRSGKEIVLICGRGKLAAVAFFFLQHFGFTNILRVSGGVEDWATKGLPVVLQETPVE